MKKPDKKELEVFSEASNAGVVRMPGRKFPGVVFQGDSLSSLYQLARKVAQSLSELTTDEDVLEDAQDLHDLLFGRVLHYQAVLEVHGLELPYPRAIQLDDGLELLPEDEDDLEMTPE